MTRGFTLIEVLAVVTVLSLVAAVSVSSLGNASESMQFQRVGARLRDLDVRGRLYARRHEAVRLVVTEDGSGVAVRPLDSDDTILEFEWPPSLSVTLATTPPDEDLVIDRRGCSPDYQVSMTDGARTRAWTVLGMTGSIVEMEGTW